ncbi:ComEC/Rec2 family competence protein [Rhodococcus sp. G-MC3]|uniref:ComEC/Rec2 family competence protein n=1 Tax=Rhodococcus sp. G-MC3 TaxID=3046209 RepID=UPI0024BAC307|nr:ComEC/Rec2 family competence protein [Rhodococcus sp. G-MC3]MDJ0394535.1 ComEC/Rec2 family competence protein [Rhodococcus sp. G-MC3]
MNEPPIRPFDVRLVPAAFAGWTATIIGIAFGSSTVALLAAAWALGVIVFFGRRAKFGSWRLGLMAMAVIGCSYSGTTAVNTWQFETSPVTAAAVDRGWVSAEVVVSEDPRRVRFTGPETVSLRAELTRIDLGGVQHTLGGRVKILAPADGWDHLVPGQRIVLRGRLSPPDRADLTLAFVRVEGPPLLENRPGPIGRAAANVRSALAAAATDALPPDQAALLPGLVVGDVSGLPEDVETDFRAAGLAHLTAVSGANFAIILGAILLVARAIGVGPYWVLVVCAMVLVAFVVVARPSPSVLRAAVMGGVGLLALVTGRRKQAVPALCAAVLGLLAWWPELAVDFGFALSVSATAGLVVLSPVWVDWLRKHGWGRAPAEIVAVAAAAHAVTAPIVAAMAGTFSVVGVVANILVAPVVAPITVVGAIAAVIAPWAGGVASLVLKLSSAPLWWLIAVARRSAAVPGAGIETPSGIAGALIVWVVTLMCIVVLRSRTLRRVLGAGAAVVVLAWFGFAILR